MKVAILSFYSPETTMAASVRLKRTLKFLSSKSVATEVFHPRSEQPAGYKKFLWLFARLKDMTKQAVNSDADVYYVSAPPVSMMFPAAALLLFGKKPVIFEERDLLTINPLLAVKFLSRVVRCNPLARMFEHWLLRRADAVLAATSGLKSVVEDHWPDLSRANPMMVISNGFEREDYSFLQTFEHNQEPGPVQVIHTGNFYGSRSPLPLVPALAELQKKIPDLSKRIHFRFIGLFSQRGEREAFEKQAEAQGVTSYFSIEPPKTRSEILRDVRSSDVALLVTHTTGSECAIPAKMFEYVAVGRPILAITSDPLVVSAMNRYKLGWCVTHDSTQTLMSVLETFVNDPAALRTMDLPGLELKEFDAQVQLEKLEKILVDLCQPKRASYEKTISQI